MTTAKPEGLMAVSYSSKQTRQQSESAGCVSEPTPLVPLVLCILAVGVTMGLVQVSWASPLVVGAVLLVLVASLRNGMEEAQGTADKDVQASQEIRQEEAFLLADAQFKPLLQKTTPRADRRFRGDSVWGLN